MGHIGKISSPDRSEIRRDESSIRDERSRFHADLPLVYKPVDRNYRCRYVLVDAGGNIVGYDSSGVIYVGDPD